MSKVTLAGFIIVPSEDLRVVTDELANHRALTLDEPGCLAFEVTRSESHPNRFDVYEEFIDRAAFDAHQLRVKDSYWGEITVNVERHYEIAGSSKNAKL